MSRELAWRLQIFTCNVDIISSMCRSPSNVDANTKHHHQQFITYYSTFPSATPHHIKQPAKFPFHYKTPLFHTHPSVPLNTPLSSLLPIPYSNHYNHCHHPPYPLNLLPSYSRNLSIMGCIHSRPSPKNSAPFSEKIPYPQPNPDTAHSTNTNTNKSSLLDHHLSHPPSTEDELPPYSSNQQFDPIGAGYAAPTSPSESALASSVSEPQYHPVGPTSNISSNPGQERHEAKPTPAHPHRPHPTKPIPKVVCTISMGPHSPPSPSSPSFPRTRSQLASNCAHRIALLKTHIPSSPTYKPSVLQITPTLPGFSAPRPVYGVRVTDEGIQPIYDAEEVGRWSERAVEKLEGLVVRGGGGYRISGYGSGGGGEGAGDNGQVSSGAGGGGLC